MKGAHMEFGCSINSSNYLTSKLVNHFRCNGYECFPAIKDCFCPADAYGDINILMGSPNAWPWYDENDPASGEYLGKIVSRIDGLDTSPHTRVISDSVNGSYAEACRTGGRELVVDGLMFALSARGMEYGKRWEREQLWNTFCGCDSGENVVKLRLNCDMNLVELRRFTPRSGPIFSNFFPSNPSPTSTNNCCALVQRLEYIANALDPYFYDTETQLVLDDKFDPCEAVTEPWEAVEDDKFCGPECCNGCNHNMLSGLFDFADDCCYCRPMFVVRKVYPVKLPSTGELGFTVRVFSGDSVFENSRVLLVDAPDKEAFDDFDIWTRVRVIKALEFSRVPAGDSLCIDGRTNKVIASTDCGDIDGRAYVYDAGGLPFTGLKVARKDVVSELFVVVEVDAFTVSEEAQVIVESFKKW